MKRLNNSLFILILTVIYLFYCCCSPSSKNGEQGFCTDEKYGLITDILELYNEDLLYYINKTYKCNPIKTLPYKLRADKILSLSTVYKNKLSLVSNSDTEAGLDSLFVGYNIFLDSLEPIIINTNAESFFSDLKISSEERDFSNVLAEINTNVMLSISLILRDISKEIYCPEGSF